MQLELNVTLKSSNLCVPAGSQAFRLAIIKDRGPASKPSEKSPGRPFCSGRWETYGVRRRLPDSHTLSLLTDALEPVQNQLEPEPELVSVGVTGF